ncbi:Maltose operon transcriptional repressor MalR, LacI family [Rubellimicrobium mesophilum DSM 19309]|uniref:Maltose operon transcriptional repressor MalR, LacI family n=1 Tax=Rubellimicrobium mesophilum DSM 19309 TaxID=442562 RepID=A0A017HRT6_9RHOB|nr:LacI family DNA-binding transcriptional regulator [Rubellimicrobium mesophilum]EYD77212.1 Maltose operon transcriptional repressor MalR, LacI family [Rubellimicrobium mesophilum DSM 19309]
MAEKVTSAQVAALAGVSQSAVSRVFTPGASVSPKTAEKVRAAAEKLGYRPNVLARAMITGKSRIIGLVVAYLENQFYPVALEHLSRALQAEGYHVLIFLADNDAAKTEQVLRELLDYQVDGIVTASVAMTNDLTARCDAAGIPVVAFNRGQDDPRLSEVTSDNVAGGRAVAEFLIAGGHQRIAHIAGWQGSSTGRDRARGFREGLAAAGREPFAVIDGLYDRETASRATRDLMARPERPDAIFVGNDHMAFAVLDVLHAELGLRVPGDVSVVGYDDVPMSAWAAYDLTTIRQPVEAMVEATVDALVRRIEGETEPRKVRLPAPLVIRGSACLPEGARRSPDPFPRGET